MRTSVSKNFRQFVLNKYSALAENEPWLRFFRYLCFGSFFDDETNQLVLPVKTIAEDFFKQPYQRSFNGKRKLEEFRDAVLPGLEWSEHSYSPPNSFQGKARQISWLGFDAAMQEALRLECLTAPEDGIDFVTGKAHGRKDRYRQTQTATLEYRAQLKTLTLNPTQRKILNYLGNIHSGHLILRKLNDNQEAVQQAIEVLPSNLQDLQRRIVASVRENPNVYYLPSGRGRTCRLSGQGDCILGLKSEVRKAATKGWYECDLRSSQFAILAAKLEAPLSRALIDSGESLWRSFYLHTHGVEADPPKEIKAVFKKTIYSLCFGKSRTNLAHDLQAAGMIRLISHPIVQELLKLRDQWHTEIRQAKGAFDVWGQWQALEPGKDSATKKDRRWAGAIAAAVIQSIEMEIIAPIFDVATKHGKSDQFTICLFQHDGATISFQSAEKRDRAQAKLKQAVEARAKELGVSTILEFSPL
jgi:hypothetical protein